MRMGFYLTWIEFLELEDVLVKSPFIETHPTILKVYSLEDLMARKFIAMYNRIGGKDIYDPFYCLDLDFDEEALFKALNLMLEFYRIDQSSSPDEHGAEDRKEYGSGENFYPRTTNVTNMKIVITGGCGFIGSNLAHELVCENQVIVIDDLSTGRLENNEDLLYNENYRFVEGSITNLNLLKQTFDGIDYVFH